MHNFVYLAKLHEPLAKHEKNLGCSACLFAELSLHFFDRASKLNYFPGVRFSDSAPTASVSLTIIGHELNRGVRRPQLTVYNSVT